MKPAVRAKATRGIRGNVVIFVGLILVLLLGFAALVVDVGYLELVTNQEQNAADSAALAGALDLDGTPAGIAAARVTVKGYAQRHIAATDPVELSDSEIVFGRWHEEANTGCGPYPCFEPYGPWPSDSEASDVNAIQVSVHRTEATNNAVGTFLARVFANDSADVSRSAVATGANKPCPSFPMTVPSCAATNDTEGDGQCDWCARFQNDNNDTAGWTGFSQHATNPKLYTMIKDVCFDADGNVAVDPNTGFCAGACIGPRPATGDEIPISNGNFLNAGKQSPCTLIQTVLNREGTPKSFKVTAPVMDYDPNEGVMCDDTKYAGTHTIAGFTTLTIFGASCGNSPAADVVVDQGEQTPSCEAPPSGKYIIAATDCDMHDPGRSDQGARIRLRE